MILKWGIRNYENILTKFSGLENLFSQKKIEAVCPPKMICY